MCRCQQGGDTASTLRRSGLECTGVSAECDTCERRRQLGVRVWEAGTCTCPYACTRMERELCGHLEADRLCCAAQRLSVAVQLAMAQEIAEALNLSVAADSRAP